nr:SIMPL domain-containing protein [Thermoleophilaceae bacterium]
LRGQGVAATDIRTGSVSVTRRRDRRGRPIAGFRAGQSVRAVVREAPRAGAVVSAAVDAGATSVSGPSFFVSDPRALVRRALGLAFQDARLKAEELGAPAPTRPGMTRVEGFVDVVFEAR